MINEHTLTAQEIAAEVARISESGTLRGRDTLQRLLAYLADRTLNGSTETLREYTIGVAVFGKPADYNPQEDASVRVQLGRLRQKLEEYYRTEGTGNAILIELPKRQFALQFHQRSSATAATVTETPAEEPEPVTALVAAHEPAVLPPPAPVWRPAARLSWPSLLLGALLSTLLWAGWSYWRAREAVRAAPYAMAASPELSELWQPFLADDRPMTLVMTMRPFLRYDRGIMWEWGMNALPQAEQEARMAELRQQLNAQVLVPWEKTYTSFGEATGVFLLTRLFEGHHRDLQLKRSDVLTWEEIAERNVIFVGAGKIGVPFDRIPVERAFEQPNSSNRIINLHPRPGEPAEFITPPPVPKDFLQTEDYALISFVPGLHGKGEILAFGATSSPGLWAAVQYMTDPRYARELVGKLKNGQGALPRYYQVVIHARFQSLVPVEIKYITHRELDVR